MNASDPHHELLTTLFRELFQTERSASLHPRREAGRFDDSAPPAVALCAVCEHATKVLTELPDVARKEGLPDSYSGRSIGALLSAARDAVIDRVVDTERSYRATLLGLRHGVDLVMLIRHVAHATGRTALAEYCIRWLETRNSLVEQVARCLAWFAANPDVAVRSPVPLRFRGEPARHAR